MGEAPGEIMFALINFFETDQWPYEALVDEAVLRLPFEGVSGNWLCYAQAREEQSQFVFYSVYPVLTPAARRAEMAELVTRINYGLVLGNFELDFTDGEVRYKTSLDIEGTQLSTELIRACVYANIFMMDNYMPAIVALLAENITPAEALGRIEGR